MPYLESNQDVSQNELFNKALMVGAVFVGAAAAGQMAYKSIAEKWGKGAIKDGKQVVKSLYGKEAGNLQKGIADEVKMPNYVEDGPQYRLVTPGNKNRAPRLKRTDGGMLDRLKSNWLSPTWSVGDGWASKFMKPADKDLALFNRRLKDLHSGKLDYSGSKLNMYENIVGAAEERNINMTGRQAVDATNHAYASDANYRARRNNDINSLEDDVELTNSIWGDRNKPKPEVKGRKPYRHVPLAKDAAGNVGRAEDWSIRHAARGRDNKLEKDLKWLQNEAKASDDFLESMKNRDPFNVEASGGNYADNTHMVDTDKIFPGAEELGIPTATIPERINYNTGKDYAKQEHRVNPEKFFPSAESLGIPTANIPNTKAVKSAQNQEIVNNYASSQEAEARDVMRTRTMNKKAMRDQRQLDFAEQQRIDRQAAQDRVREKERIEAEQKQANSNAKKGRTAMWQTMNSDSRSVVGNTYGVDPSRINYNGFV